MLQEFRLEPATQHPLQQPAQLAPGMHWARSLTPSVGPCVVRGPLQAAVIGVNQSPLALLRRESTPVGDLMAVAEAANTHLRVEKVRFVPANANAGPTLSFSVLLPRLTWRTGSIWPVIGPALVHPASAPFFRIADCSTLAQT